MKWIALVLAAVALAGVSSTAAASPKTAGFISCPPKVRNAVNQLVVIEQSMAPGNHSSWAQLTARTSGFLVSAKHVVPASITASCKKNVWVPALQANGKYIAATLIVYEHCPQQQCDQNHIAQVNRALNQANASVDRAASNLP